MKSIISGIIATAVLLAGFQPVIAAEKTVAERVKGHILLQVQNHGEAWYVSPVDGARYYMKDGPTAYEMMRYFGLGITEVDFAKLEGGNQDLTNRLLGRIVLRVQARGEAYYIHPNGTIHYLQNGEAAYQVMRSVSLGVTNTDLEKVVDKDMPKEVLARLQRPVVSPVAVTPVVALQPIVTLEDIEMLAEKLAKKIVEEQQNAKLAEEERQAQKLITEEEDKKRAAEFAEQERLGRMEEAKRVRLAIQSEGQKLRITQEYVGWLEDYEENRKAIETLNKCGQQSVINTQTVQNFCDQEIQKAGVTLTDVRVSSQKYGSVDPINSTISSVDNQCYFGATVRERLSDTAACDTWMNHYKSFVGLRWEASEKMSKAIRPIEEMSIMWNQAFYQTEQNGGPITGAADLKTALRVRLASVGIHSSLIE